MTQRSLKLGIGLALGLALAVANTAAARVLPMSGEWFMNRGPLVDIPANGGVVGCGGPGSLSAGCLNGLKPLNGGILAAQNAVGATGSAPAQFTVGANAFAAAGGAANRQTVAVALIPTVIQLASQFSLLAPAGTGTAGTGAVPAGVASFQKNAFSNDPMQAARLAANFTWCPPTGNCATTTLSLVYGKYQAQIKYTGGANAFGGSMNMMLRDTGVVSIDLNGAATGGAVLHQLVGGTSNPIFGKQVAGGAYANARVLTLAAGPMFTKFTTSFPCTGGALPPLPAGCGVIVAQGAPAGSLPGSQNFDWGMPWTTGTVFVKNLPGGANDPATTFSVKGTDSRTALGVGQITMVAGATTERKPSGNHFAALEIVRMNFGPIATPALSTPAIVAMATLMLLAGGYLARGTFASRKSQA